MANYNNNSRAKPNYLYSIISVTLVLFLLGFFSLLLLYPNQLVKNLRERVNILVELKADESGEAIQFLRQTIKEAPYLKEGSIRYISKDEAAKIMQKDFGEEFLKLNLPNPFYDILSFNVKATYMQADSLNKIRTLLKENNITHDVFYQENLASSISSNIKRIIWLCLGISAFLIIVAIILIHNTIRLALYANRFLIKNMELVGASWEFISKPYLLRSVKHGIISSILAIAGLIALLFMMNKILPELEGLHNLPKLAFVFGGILILGVLINFMSTYYVVKKYLKMRVDDLY